jgi:2'-5' RNA ligase
MPTPEILRTFIAVPLSEEVIRQLENLERQLKRTTPDRAVSWVKPTHIHVTLSFLGDVLIDRIEPIKRALTVVARHVQPFEYQAGGLGAFPNATRPRVLWVGVQDPTSWLHLLQEAVAEALSNIGFERESRPFSPHLTLGRVRRNASREEVQALGKVLSQTHVDTLGSVSVEALIFFKSELKPSGAVYTPLATFALEETSPSGGDRG